MPRAAWRKSIEIVQVLPGASGMPTHAVEGWPVNAADPVPVTSALVGVNGIDPVSGRRVGARPLVRHPIG